MKTPLEMLQLKTPYFEKKKKKKKRKRKTGSNQVFIYLFIFILYKIGLYFNII